MSEIQTDRFKGRPVTWCATCGEFLVDSARAGMCPKCRTVQRRNRCTRCLHTWVPRSEKPPRVCPSCKSPYWDRERVR